MPHRIAFRADDFGLCPSVNRGIVHAVQHGVVKNVSMQANGLAVRHAAKLVRTQMPDVCLGVHVSLNCEWVRQELRPILPAKTVPSLVDQRGVFLPTPNDLHQRKASVQEMLMETSRQIARFHRLGLSPRYMDAHMGVSWVHDWSDPHFSRRLKDGLLDLCRAFKLLWVDDIPSMPLTDNLVKERIANNATLVRVVTHPANDEPDLRLFAQPNVPADSVAAERNGDRLKLCSPQLLDAIKDGRIESVAFVD
jgi:chitin disaccharide deacetylase